MDQQYKIPVTVGIVGHLDAITTDHHKVIISELFCELAASYPSSPITLFSSLADGADRFVARIFLELKRSDPRYMNRFDLIAPLPFKQEDYMDDFDDSSRKEFGEILSASRRSFCVCPDSGNDDRASHYFRAGKFVADSSLILIAMWDGAKGKKGGTADVVRYKIAGDDDYVDDSTFEYDGTVFIIPCEREAASEMESYGTEEEEPLTLGKIRKDPAINDALEKIEEFNSISGQIERGTLTKSEAQLFEAAAELEPSQQLLAKWYSVFDTLSLKYRKGDLRVTVWLFIFGFLFIIALEVYSNIFTSYLTLGFSMLMVVVATAIYFYATYRKDHKKYLYNRTLAEALRIQLYWNIAGINKSVSDYFLRIHRKDFTWIKHIMSAMYGLTYLNKPITSETIAFLTDSWVKRQADFFSNSIARINRQMLFFSRISNTCYVIAFILLFSIFFLGDYYSANNLLNNLLVVIGIFLGIFALIKAYVQMKGYEQLLNQYEMMKVIYRRAESKIMETDTYNLDAEKKKQYLKDLFFLIGREALIENGNWYLVFKEREPEIEGI